MKFTLSWLRDYLKTDVDVDNLIFGLTDLGLEVESVTDPAKQISHFTVGEIVQADQHPNADRLKVCKVSTEDGLQQIICGAPNACVGKKVVVAKPGDYIPGLDTVIKVGKIRGVESRGMMCSEKELLLSEEHDGIIELDVEVPVGAKFIDHCDYLDIIIDIAITPNRPDALGVRGVARDLAAKGLGEFKARSIPKIKGTFKSPISVRLSEDVVGKDCPLFIGRYIKGVNNGQSPKWLKDRLIAIGLRPISALVDITNFITFDSARPLHVFDADKLGSRLIVRKANREEKISALDGVDYSLSSDDTVIVSGNLIESIAGIIGGMNSACETDTKNVFLESAYFNPISTAKTGRRLKINSDARYRFERGVDPLFVESGINFATELILEICGGEVSEVIIEGEIPRNDKTINLRSSRVESLVGMKISEEEQIRILTKLGFQVSKSANSIVVNTPSWRPDIFGEADLIEEIVRIKSLSKLEGKPLKKTNFGVLKPVLTPLQMRASRLRREIALFGMNECISYSFIDAKSAELFSGEGKPIALLNPISSEMTHMRPSLLPGLLQAARRNQARSYNDLKLFELGEVFFGANPGEQAINATGIFVGRHLPKNSYDSLRDVDVFDAKKIVELALKDMSVLIENLSLNREGLPDYFHPKRAGTLALGPKNVLAYFGELHPRILKNFDLKGPAIAFEIFIDKVPFPKKRKLVRPQIKLSEYQSVERDFAFEVESSCEVNLIKRAILNSEKGVITEARIFDIFEGKEAELQLGKNRKSVAVMVRLQSFTKTFSDHDLDFISNKIISHVKKATGAKLRS